MKRILLLVALSLSIAFTTNVDAKKKIRTYKKNGDISRTLRSLFVFTPQAYLNYDTQQVEIECNMPPSNGTVHIVDTEGSSVASHTLHAQTQVSLPLPQEQGYYTLIIECDEGEYVGEVEIEE